MCNWSCGEGGAIKYQEAVNEGIYWHLADVGCSTRLNASPKYSVYLLASQGLCRALQSVTDVLDNILGYLEECRWKKLLKIRQFDGSEVHTVLTLGLF